jgi:hypothetical protein
MSLTSKFFVFFLVGAGFLLGTFLQKSAPIRNPASQKLPAPVLPKPWAHSLVGKHNRFANLSLTPVDGIADYNDQEIRLRAHVTLLLPVQGDLEFTWILPEGVTLVNGELEDVWSGVLPGQTVTTDLTVLGFSKESQDKTIVFRADGLVAGNRTGGAVSFATGDFRRNEANAGVSAQMSMEGAASVDSAPDQHRFIKKVREAQAQ